MELSKHNTDAELETKKTTVLNSGWSAKARIDAFERLAKSGLPTVRDEGRGFLVITHYQRLLDHIKPDVVHIMSDGKIIKSGGPELALEVENNGYSDLLDEAS